MNCNVVNIFCKVIGVLLVLLLLSARQVSAESVVALTSSNFDEHIGKYELVFLNFYADWCRFSQILAPVFEEAAKNVQEHTKGQVGKVLFAKVDCDRETSIAAKHRITKYPTLKLVRNGVVMKREYRGQRSAEAMKNYIIEMLKDQVKEIPHEAEAQHVEEKKPALLGYFAGKETQAYATFRRVASDLRDDCNFYFVARPTGENLTVTADAIHFKPPRAKFGEKHETYPSLPHLYEELKKWAGEKCIPLVREITFENAEELTEEGLPFLILFHHPDDKESVEEFTKVVHEQLQNDKHAINPLIADGVKFAHPLQHLGKTVKDLPLIAIDSFRHMYRFPDFAHLKVPGKLKAFVDDLYSGKLHREFHYGPDPTVGGAETEAQATDPPESTFKNLAPSRQRYTILKDEL
ncbi:endoplasmic reticulum protein 44 [Rhipicephalus microplus]|uniref:Putative endoplasmic reticulum resident protein 44 n=1 Tax=Rhipicephalus microplus TaxID=6941 RepID=A0A6M2CV67_RHIMP|nr:endoplasmic reticulum resident protein 44-like [Rhipicephalus microplus]